VYLDCAPLRFLVRLNYLLEKKNYGKKDSNGWCLLVLLNRNWHVDV
jgi:hypothetical protein